MATLDGAIFKLLKKRLVLLLFVLLCGTAAATDMLLENATWTRYNKDTRALEWEFKAETAKPVGNKEWTCTKPSLRTFKLIVNNGKKELQQDLALKSDTGTYTNEIDNAKAKLLGNVVIDIFGKDPTRFTTDHADITTDDKKSSGTRIQTDAPVTIASPKRTIKGTGFIAEEQGEKDAAKKDQSWMLIEKDVTMTIEGVSAGFPAIGAEKTPAEGAQPQTTTVTCDGPAKIDRVRGEIDFQNNVVVVREGTEMYSKGLKLDYVETEKDGKGGSSITKMVAGGGVKIITKDSQQNEQHFFGDTFEWDQKTASGKLLGSPARTIAGENIVNAPVVEFDQASDKIKYTGGAVAEIKMKIK